MYSVLAGLVYTERQRNGLFTLRNCDVVTFGFDENVKVRTS